MDEQKALKRFLSCFSFSSSFSHSFHNQKKKEFSEAELSAFREQVLTDAALSVKPESLLSQLASGEKARLKRGWEREIIQPLIRRVRDLMRDIRTL